MRIFALSDIHVDFEPNAQWVDNLSTSEYRDDVLILAGDVSDELGLLERCLTKLAFCFRRLIYVPGNHELWVIREPHYVSSLQKFAEVIEVAQSSGALVKPWCERGVSIIPLLGWYDYSFGEPGESLKASWMDFHACRWPEGFDAADVAAHFAALNPISVPVPGTEVITVSHFLPRIDVMPLFVPAEKRALYPVLGSARLDEQLRALSPSIHVYGHSHVNRRVRIDGITYVNNAFGYPRETRIAAKRLLKIHDC